MMKNREEGISEVIGALMLVTVLMTGMAIISIVLLSFPPPSSSQQAVLGVKCAWCPDLQRFDILIDHEGGENLSTNNLIFIMSVNGTSEIFTPDYIYAPTDPQQLYIPPVTCNDAAGLESRRNWDDVASFGTGQSLKYRYYPNLSDGDPPRISFIAIQQPASFGNATIARLNINYIQNFSEYGTILGAGGLPVSSGTYFVTPMFDRSTLVYSGDGCDVDFIYTNPGEDEYYGWGSRGNPWNYLEFSEPSDYVITPNPPQSDFPHTETSVKIMTVSKFRGTVEYRLGYRIAQITCDQRLIDMWKT